jgi:hypothetical protein
VLQSVFLRQCCENRLEEGLVSDAHCEEANRLEVRREGNRG